MAALTSMFTFIKLYLYYFTCLIFGGTFSTDKYTGVFHRLAFDIINNYYVNLEYNLNSDFKIFLPGEPILQIFLGIFVIGAIIGLVRRLTR